MTRTLRSTAARLSLRWAAVALIVVALALGGGYAAGRTGAGPLAPDRAAAAPSTQSDTLQPFEAIGLPSGRAVGVPAKLSFPAGFSLKHVHGGPTYVYVLSGSLDIIDSDGTRTTYRAGDFFSEAPGHIHTVVVPQGAEVFVLEFLVTGAEATVPVQ